MARQPLILAVAVLGLLSCRQDPDYEGAFDQPIAIAVLPTALGPFDEPVGLVANAHGGAIGTLALKQGRFLTDDPSASFLRGNWIPTGGARVLSSVAAYAPDRYDVRVFAGDRAFGQLVEVPWIVGSDTLKADGETRTFPVEQPPTWDETVCFVPAGAAWTPDDGTPCPGQSWEKVLTDVQLKHGYTSTESWTLTWSEARSGWVVEGSRSGRQPEVAVNGVPYKATIRRIGFTVKAKSSALNDGDRAVFSTDNGVIEHDVGGTPLALAMAPDHSALAMIVHDAVLDTSVLRWFDPATGTVSGDVALPAGALPHRLEWDESGILWVADAGLPAAYELAIGATSVIEHPLPWPILDIAPMTGEQRRIFVLADDGNTVWVYDADTDQPIDLNHSVPGDQGMYFGSAVTGIGPIHTEYKYQERREAHRERRLIGRSVAVALAAERVVFMEEDTGCLVQDVIGPRTTPPSGVSSFASDVTPNFELTGGPVMVRNAHNTRHVTINNCAGIARDESWTVRYDGAVGAWRVRSSSYGEHTTLAYEDQRYVSDNGEVSFTIRAGPIPTQDSWEFRFTVDEGSLVANGDGDGDGLRETTIGPPGDPVGFSYIAGRDEQTEIDWQNGVIGTVDGRTERAYMVVPATGFDNVARINPETGLAELRWD